MSAPFEMIWPDECGVAPTQVAFVCMQLFGRQPVTSVHALIWWQAKWRRAGIKEQSHGS